MPATALLRGAAAALLLSLAAVSGAEAAHRGGHGPGYGGPAASVGRVHVGPYRHHGGVHRAFHHRKHAYRHGHGIGHRHHGFHGPRHYGRAFFPGARYGHRHHGPRFHGVGYGARHGYFPRRRFFHAGTYGHGGYGYGGRAIFAAAPAFGTVAGAAPFGPLYNRPVGACY
jgi:hypothetical protein